LNNTLPTISRRAVPISARKRFASIDQKSTITDPPLVTNGQNQLIEEPVGTRGRS
jgi:hypothetical protein